MSRCHPHGRLTFSGLATGKSRPMGACASSVAALPTDPIGTTTVTFDGVPAGSEIRVQYSDMTDAAGIESCVANQVLAWQVFADGSPNNTVRIVIIDMAHKIKEFTYTSRVGNQSIPIQSETDKWWLNP